MYSTKNIENILIAELSRKQERKFMEDVSRDAEISYKEIWQIRKKEVYQRIFGNKYRIWIPLDIEVDSVNGNNINDYKELFNRYKDYSLVKYIIINIYTNFVAVAKYFSQLPEEIDNHTPLETILLYWLKGYIRVGNNIIKVGTLIKKLQSLIKKRFTNTNISDKEETTLNDFLVNLETALADFNKRDRDERLPKELYTAGRNVPDEEIYGSTIKKDKLWICISRHPADVGAMSTRQGWKSCQNLDKDELNTVSYDNLNWHVKYDVALGTCVAYLITESNIKRSKERQNVPNEYDDKFKGKDFIPKTSLFPLLSPTARVLIKPYFSEDKQVYLTIGTTPVVYGDNTYFDVFTNTVNSYFEERQSNINGFFRIPRELYNEAIARGNMIEVKNGKIFEVYGANDMYNRENEVPSRYTDIILNKLKNIASSMEKSEEGIEKEFTDSYDNSYHIIANKANYIDKNIKNDEITIINSNLTNCDITAKSSISLGSAYRQDIALFSMIESELTEQEKTRLNKVHITRSDILKILKEWEQKESNIGNCVFKCDDFIYINGKYKFNNCIFEARYDINISSDTFSNIKNSIFSTKRLNIKKLDNLSKPKDITGNTYNTVSLCIELGRNSPKKTLYFVGDTFNNSTLDISYTKTTIYFIDCTFNGELLKGKYKVQYSTHKKFYDDYNTPLTADSIRNVK